MSALRRPEPALSASEGVWAGARLHAAASSRQFMDLDCTQQGILFSDERKNIQQPVFALGCVGHTSRLRNQTYASCGREAAVSRPETLSPLRAPAREGAGSPQGRWTPQLPGGGKAARFPSPPSSEAPPRRPPPRSPASASLPPGPAARAWAALGEPAPAWGPLTASPAEYCISWL